MCSACSLLFAGSFKYFLQKSFIQSKRKEITVNKKLKKQDVNSHF